MGPAQGQKRGKKPKENNFLALIEKIRAEHAAYKLKKKKAEINEKGKDKRHQLRNKISAAENRLINKLTDLRLRVELMKFKEKALQLAQILDSSVKKQDLTLLKKAVMNSAGKQDSTSGLSIEDVVKCHFNFS